MNTFRKMLLVGMLCLLISSCGNGNELSMRSGDDSIQTKTFDFEEQMSAIDEDLRNCVENCKHDESIFNSDSEIEENVIPQPNEKSVQKSGGYKVLQSRVRLPGAYSGYVYEYYVAYDPGHLISNCPELSERSHLNIDVWKRKSSGGSWTQVNAAHISLQRWCKVIIHDLKAKPKKDCEIMNWCTTAGNIGRAVAITVTEYAVVRAIISVIAEKWWVIVAAASL